MNKPIRGISTLCVHAGEIRDSEGSPHTPLYTTTTFAFESTADLISVIEGRRPGNLYTRYGSNPTIRSLEVKLAALENTERALVYSSGMAAISSLCLAHGSAGIICIGDVYGGTVDLLQSQLPALGISTHLLLREETDRLEELLSKGSRLVICETPANPTLQITDIRNIARLTHAHGGLLAVDNTFATPIAQQPLIHGADLVVHSATKYLGGHSDITAGAIMGADSLLKPLDSWRRALGQTPSPEVAALLSRSIRTLALRVQRHSENALAVAQAMEEHPSVRRVYYPGLPSSPDHPLAMRQMSAFGGMLSIDLTGNRESTSKVVDRLKLFTIAPSLGGVESLVSQPVLTSHRDMNDTDRLRRGITGTMIRLSIGLEDPHDLIDDLCNAFQGVGK